MSVLLIAEHNNKEVKSFTLNAITAASQIDQDLHVLLIGHNADDVAKSLSEVPLVKKYFIWTMKFMKIILLKIILQQY